MSRIDLDVDRRAAFLTPSTRDSLLASWFSAVASRLPRIPLRVGRPDMSVSHVITSRLAARVQLDSLSAVAHDLRLPLSHIKGFVSSLLRDDVEWDEETRIEFLAEIELETDRLAQLVDSLLPGTTRRDNVGPGAEAAFTEPASVVDGALHRIRGLVGGRVVRRHISACLPAVVMDAIQMERVLSNLLQNAIKYSPPGTPIAISARTTRGGELELSVEDEGPGIPTEDHQRIFEPFFRKQAAKQSNVPGNGIGLAICQSIVLAHGGRIRVTNRRGGGARFSVFLPGHKPAQQFDRGHVAEDETHDLAKHSGRGRRSTDAQTAFDQPQGERVRRARGSGRYGGVEADRGAPIRSVAA
jgi:two-component system sensor histidine kinase KdpD